MAAPIQGPAAAPEIDLEGLQHSLRRPRTLFSYLMSMLTGAATIAGTVPFVFGALLLVVRGTASSAWAPCAILRPPR